MKTEAYTFSAPGRFGTVRLSESQAAHWRSRRKCVSAQIVVQAVGFASPEPRQTPRHETNLFLRAGAGCKHQPQALRLPPPLPARHAPVKPPCEQLARVLRQALFCSCLSKALLKNLSQRTKGEVLV